MMGSPSNNVTCLLAKQEVYFDSSSLRGTLIPVIYQTSRKASGLFQAQNLGKCLSLISIPSPLSVFILVQNFMMFRLALNSLYSPRRPRDLATFLPQCPVYLAPQACSTCLVQGLVFSAAPVSFLFSIGMSGKGRP